MSTLLHILMLVPVLSVPPADSSYEKVQRWIDTVSSTDDGSYQYLNEYERRYERNRYRYGPGKHDDFEPTGYPSPYRREHNWA